MNNEIKNDVITARVIAEHKGAYKVKSEKEEYLAKVTGKRIFDASSREDYPAVGDWVLINDLGNNQAVIQEILPRKTIIKRKRNNREEAQVIATNIDVAFVVESINNRDFNLNRFERYFAIAKDGGVKPAIILNKVDLISKEELDLKLNQIKERFEDVDCIPVSTKTEQGMEILKMYIEKEKVYCFLGSSGVGKSSLINKLLGKEIIRTEDISSYADRGKHATTNRQMYFLLNGGIVIDNPGMREVGMTDTDTGIEDLFDEIIDLAKGCKYNNCTHIHEPGCQILAAVKSGKLDEGRYSNYINLRKEADHYQMTKLEQKQKEHQFGKFVKRALKDLKK